MTTCIYCKRNSSSSSRKAHIVPVGLIDNNVTLPLGAECDQCNEYAGKLEKALLHHNRIAFHIVNSAVPGKKGKQKRSLGHFKNIQGVPGGLSFQVDQKFVESFIFAGNHNQLNLRDPKEFDDFRFRRALFHIGLNYVAHKFGVERALKADCDNVRRYVRQAKRDEAWPYVQVSYPDNMPRKKLEIGWVEGACGLTVRLKLFIDDFYMDILNTGLLQRWAEKSLDGNIIYHS